MRQTCTQDEDIVNNNTTKTRGTVTFCLPERDTIDEEDEEIDGANASSKCHTFVCAKLLRPFEAIMIPDNRHIVKSLNKYILVHMMAYTAMSKLIMMMS